MANVWVYTQRDVTSGRKSAAGKDDGRSHKARARITARATWAHVVVGGVLCTGPSPVPRLPIPPLTPVADSPAHIGPSNACPRPNPLCQYIFKEIETQPVMSIYFQGNRPKASSSHGSIPELFVTRVQSRLMTSGNEGLLPRTCTGAGDGLAGPCGCAAASQAGLRDAGG